MNSVTNDSICDLMAENGRLVAEVALLEAECKERVAEKMEWLGERGTLQAEVTRLNELVDVFMQREQRMIFRADYDADTKRLEDEITRLQSSLTLSREEGRREGREEAAEILLSRMSVMMATPIVQAPIREWIEEHLTEVIATIRSEAKGERKQK